MIRQSRRKEREKRSGEGRSVEEREREEERGVEKRERESENPELKVVGERR